MAVKVAVIDPGFGGMALGFKEAGFNVTVVFDKYVKAPDINYTAEDWKPCQEAVAAVDQGKGR